MKGSHWAAIAAAAPTTIIVAGREELLSVEYVHQLAKALVVIGRSRQGTANWLMGLLYAYDDIGGEIYEVIDGERHRILITDDMEDRIFGKDDSKAWTTNTKRFALRKPKRRAKHTLILRLQMFDAVFKILEEPVTVDP